MRQYHEIQPIYNKESKILILGSFPSIKSRQMKFYYSHPKNQFWPILQEIFNEKIKNDPASRTEFVLKHNIALWDVIASCDILSSKDSSIKNIKVNDINKIVNNSRIKAIFTTGKKATELYEKYLYHITKIKSIYLPSTSPVYQSMKLDEKIKKYEIIKSYLQ